ncbi:putative NRPS-like protein biosynthetic cluster [Trichoderma asperellum]|uniref:putative NRPS-like protein biosynthetic cluster n=1 Tax=Trichoderma asperellum TaxID=101201 RepID=UPI00331AF91A|nr:putative NRPS-like protein biosynthetic cluster [Trichoderma asperellum]
MKNPIFRTTIIGIGKNKFALALLKETASHWSYPSSLRSLLEITTAQKLQLGEPAARYALVLEDAANEGRSFFAISLYHTHCDAFTRFLIDKEISQILQSPSDYARAENIERPWFGAFVKHLRLIAPQEDVMKFWENYLRGANVANIHPLEQAVVSGSVENVLTDMLPVPFTHPQSHSDAPRNPTQVILAAWAMALAKLSGHRDITFGLCRHGRSSNTFPDVWRVMGPLVNAVPFRISIQSKEEPVTELLQRVQDDITTTTQWEQGFAPGVVPSADGRPWVQSFVNLRSELNKSKDVCNTNESNSEITKIVPRPDLDNFNTDYHWAVILMIKRQRNQYEVSMLYNSSLIDHKRASTLFTDFKLLMGALEADVEINVGDLLE